MKPIRLANLLILTAGAVLILALVWSSAAAVATGTEANSQPGPRSVDAATATVTLYTVADSYVYSASPTKNYGTAPTLIVGREGTSAIGRALFRFDLATIPAGATIQSATFEAYLVQSSTSPSTLDVELKRVDTSWQEATVTWNTLLSYTGANNVTGVGTALVYYSWDVASVVQTWVNGSPNHGLALVSKDEGKLGWRGFASKESAVSPGRYDAGSG